MEIGDFAVGGILFVLFVMGISTFWGSYAPVNIPNAENYTFMANVQTVADTLNGTSNEIVTKVGDTQTESDTFLGFDFSVVTGIIDVVLLPFAIMGLLLSLISDFFVLLGVPSWASSLIFGAIGVTVAFLIVSVIIKYKTKN